MTPSTLVDCAIVSKDSAASFFKAEMSWEMETACFSTKRSCICTKSHGVTFRMTASLISIEGYSLAAIYHSHNEIKYGQYNPER